MKENGSVRQASGADDGLLKLGLHLAWQLARGPSGSAISPSRNWEVGPSGKGGSPFSGFSVL